MNAHPLLQCASDHIRVRAKDFDIAHERACLLEIGTCAELLLAAPSAPGFAGCIADIAAATLLWLRSGLLEDTIRMHPETAYHATLLLRVALRCEEATADDRRSAAERLLPALLLDRESPSVTQWVVWSHLEMASLADATHRPRAVEVRPSFDKRVLRRRTDESDIAALHMAAHLVRDGRLAPEEIPVVLPHVLLLQTCRDADINRLSVLLLLNLAAFAPPRWLLRHAESALLAMTPAADTLLPPPLKTSDHDEYRDRMLAGLQVRGTLACGALLSMGNQFESFYAADH